MTRQPKSIQNHYADSLFVNSTNLKSFLITHSISAVESENMVILISKCYNQNVDTILKTCNNDWTKVESFSSPLILFIQCIDKIINNNDQIVISLKCKSILQSFLDSLESWMLW